MQREQRGEKRGNPPPSKAGGKKLTANNSGLPMLFPPPNACEVPCPSPARAARSLNPTRHLPVGLPPVHAGGKKVPPPPSHPMCYLLPPPGGRQEV
eukprot:243674-Chlamydomonas_euryale.AAC.2